MSEKTAVKDVFIKLGICIAFASLYMLAGWGEFLEGAKWLRRFVAPLVLAGGLFYITRDWKHLVSMPLVGLGASLGYGADETWLKILKRSYCGLLMGAGSVAGFWFNKKIAFSIFQIVLVAGCMAYLGAFNPLSDARAEEFAIGFLIAFLPLMAARRPSQSA
jgi:hypothetical protein